MVIIEGDMVRLDEFVHLYHLKESKKYGSSWIFLRPFGTRSPGTSLYMEMGGRLF